ncbi:hypothetical protein BOX15_Mlig018362g1 [Macrostomum lignano]|uniref:SCP domain-containing protein n=1 Tax=Macrostomum lignano TaxID=282301 RepID=A0A267F4C9_9PLAT|nr:hypothetical protein BOX15_Mlig018362g1 [Macrostomum lignano]
MAPLRSQALLLLLLMMMIALSPVTADSSKENRKIAETNYGNSPVERWVATHLGDELPNMRNDLIRRKNAGEGFVERHAKAYVDSNNWSVDWNNDRKERANPWP